MYMMKGSVKVDLVRRILDLYLELEVPFRLTEQVEWHEFIPLGFLLIQSLRPKRIVEVGTSTGDSYLSFCQAVQACNLSAECKCILRSKGSHREMDSSQPQEFRAYHDALYAGFSKIEMATANHRQIEEGPNKFDLMHIISMRSASELYKMCSTWLPKLNYCGVALISGLGQFDQSGFEARLNDACLRYCMRILQFENWVAILSIQPIGIVRDLLHSPHDEFLAAAMLLRLLGGRIQAQHILRSVSRLRSEVEVLNSRLAAAEESEIEAQFLLGQTHLRLDKMWAEKEELREQLCTSQTGTRGSTEDAKLVQEHSDDGLFTICAYRTSSTNEEPVSVAGERA